MPGVFPGPVFPDPVFPDPVFPGPGEGEPPVESTYRHGGVAPVQKKQERTLWSLDSEFKLMED